MSPRGRRRTAPLPWALFGLVASLSLFGIIVTAALLGHSAQRDFETGSFPLFFTQPINKAAFLGGRFFGGLVTNAFVFLAIPLGVWFGALLPFLDAERLGPPRIRHCTTLVPVRTLQGTSTLHRLPMVQALRLLLRERSPAWLGELVLQLVAEHQSSGSKGRARRVAAALRNKKY